MCRNLPRTSVYHHRPCWLPRGSHQHQRSCRSQAHPVCATISTSNIILPPAPTRPSSPAPPPALLRVEPPVEPPSFQLAASRDTPSEAVVAACKQGKREEGRLAILRRASTKHGQTTLIPTTHPLHPPSVELYLHPAGMDCLRCRAL